MRTATATAAAVTTTLLGAGAAAVTAAALAGRYAADAALRTEPGQPLPGSPRLSVHSTAAGRVELTRSLASLRPGTYGLTAPGVHAVVGPLLPDAPHGPDTVVRRLVAVTHGSLDPGTRVTLTPRSTWATRAPPSGWTTPTWTFRESSAHCPPGSCPGPATPG